MLTGLVRIVSPGAVLLVFFGVLGTGSPPMEAPNGRVSEELSIEQSRALADEADELVRAGRVAEAYDAFAELHRLFPNNSIYVWYLAEAQRAQGDHGAAAELLELYMDQSPLPWAACPVIGDDYWEAGRFDDGLASYQRCLELEPSNPDYVLALGLARERLGQLDEAAVLFAEGERLAPDYLDFPIARGRLLLRRGKPIEAEHLIRDLLNDTSDPLPDALFALGLALERQGRLDEAEQVLDAGLALAPHYSGMSVALARLKLWAGEAEAAHQLATSELAKHPNDVDAMLVSAMALERLNRLDGARAMAERLIERSPGYGDAYLILGRIAENQGRDFEARRLYNRLLEIQPDHSDAARALARVSRGPV